MVQARSGGFATREQRPPVVLVQTGQLAMWPVLDSMKVKKAQRTEIITGYRAFRKSEAQKLNQLTNRVG